MNKLEIKNEGKNIEIKLYGEIGEAGWFEEDADTKNGEVKTLTDLDKILKENKDAAKIDVYINSTGGSVFDGIAIYNMLKRHRAYKRVFIEGFACSVASVIAMAGNSIVMPKTSMMMIHNAWTVAMGNAKELRKVAEDLDIINNSIRNAYLSKSNLDESKLVELMDNESFLTADQCLEYGLCTKIDDSLDVEETTNKALEQYSNLYQNKLDTLNAIKNAIKDIEQVEETEVEETEADAGEVLEEEVANEPVEETGEPVEANEVEEAIEEQPQVQEEVQNIKENALKRFFNLKQED